VLDQLVDVLLLLLELRLDGLELGLLLLLDVHFFGGRLALGEGITTEPIISHVPLYLHTQYGRAYPDRAPPARDAPDPASPPAMARTDVEKRRADAGRAFLMMAVRNMIADGGM
jgi:hypothetical protein